MKSVALTAAMAAAAVFAEPKLVKFPVDVVNAGFEDGKTGWSGGKSMGVDETVAHGSYIICSVVSCKALGIQKLDREI